MKVTLINPRFGPVGDEDLISSACFPYGIAYIAKFIMKDNHTVTVLDPYVEEMNVEELEDRISNIDTDYIGITAMSVQYQQVKQMVRVIRKHHSKNVKIILGGLLSTYSYKTVLEHLDIDTCVIGDGLETARWIINDEPLENIPGIAYRNGICSRVVTNPKQEAFRDINELGLPPYHLFNMDAYCRGRLWIDDLSIKERYQAGVKADRVMTVLTSWGCPYHCHFCSKSTDKVRQKTIKTIINEIQHLKATYHIEGIHFVDELVFSSKKRGLELASEMKKLNIIWDAQARVNTIDEELCNEIKKAGCTAIGLGIESGNDRVLKAMNKTGVTREKIIRAIRAAKGAGLIVRAQLIMGYPGEDVNSVWDTVSMFKQLNLPGRRFALILPLPGSHLYDQCVSSNRISSESEYLDSISLGYGRSRFFNFMGMSDKEVLELKHKAERVMEKNYLIYLLKTMKIKQLVYYVDAKYNFTQRCKRKLSKILKR